MFPLPYADHLVQVRNGLYSLDSFLAIARHALANLEDAANNTTLPDTPQEDRLAALYQEIILD